MSIILLFFLACAHEEAHDTAPSEDLVSNSCTESVFYTDSDLDGYGDPAAVTVRACEKPFGYVGNDRDCNDEDDTIHPGAVERCDGIDNDCNAITDNNESEDAPTWYADLDHDGYGDPAVTTVGCDGASGYVIDSTDCDDNDAAVSPSGIEVCDGIDNDCNGVIDDNPPTDGKVYYRDSDDDLEGDAASPIRACSASDGYVQNPFDCNDADESINTSVDEVCDGIDNDCSGSIDDDPVDGDPYYEDADADSYGNPRKEKLFCDLPTGYVADDSDCDDNNAAISPGATEVCDWIDDDCDGVEDDVADENLTTWYIDNDWDGFGDPSVSETTCSPSFMSATTDNTDCDDFNALVNPMAPEIVGNSVDDNCDGTTL